MSGATKSSSSSSSAGSDLNSQSRIQLYMNQLKKNFECTICIDYFEEPVITNCQHVFCKKCIESYIGSKRTQGCPLCKSVVNLRSLRSFSVMNHYVEKTKKLSDAFEKDCKALASSPRDTAKRTNVTSSTSMPNTTVTTTTTTTTPRTLSDVTNQICHSPSSIQKRKRINSNEHTSNKKKRPQENQPSPANMENTNLPFDPTRLADVSRINDTVSFEDEATAANTNKVVQETNEKKMTTTSTSIMTRNIDKTSLLLHVTDQSEITESSSAARNPILSVYDLKQAAATSISDASESVETVQAAAVQPEVTSNDGDPLKFRKEKSDISDHQSSFIGVRPKATTTVTAAADHTTRTTKSPLNSTKSADDAKSMFKEARESITEAVVIPDTHVLPTDHHTTEPEVHIPFQRIDETILFESNNKSDKNGENKPRKLVDSSTNTVRVETREIGIQVNMNDEMIRPRAPPPPNIDVVTDAVFVGVYQMLESESIREYVDEFIRSIPSIVPESPPTGPPPQSRIQPSEIDRRIENEVDETSVMNQSVVMGIDSNSGGPLRGKKQAAKKDFLNTSVFASSSISPSYHRRKPSLEFIVSQSSSSTTATTRAHLPPPATTATTTTTTPSKNSRSNEDVTFSDGQQQPRPAATHLDVIDGTPIKPRSSLAHLTASGRNGEQLRELEERLSKSANRIEISNTSRMLLETSIGRMAETTSTITLTLTSDKPTASLAQQQQQQVKQEETFHADESNQVEEALSVSMSNAPTLVINTDDQPTLVLTTTDQSSAGTSIDSTFKEPTAMPPPPPPPQPRLPPPTPAPRMTTISNNRSFNINSLDTTFDHQVSSLANITNASILNSTSNLEVTRLGGVLNKENSDPSAAATVCRPPPHALDILGTSIITQVTITDSVPSIAAAAVHDSSMNVSRSSVVCGSAEEAASKKNLDASAIVTKQEKVDVNDEAATRKALDSLVNNKKETQLLTDSAMMAIDNFCENRLIVGVNQQRKQPSPTSSSSSMSPLVASSLVNMPTRIEFVTSLLKPDMKNILSNYAAQIKATLANDVTETTTHLIVDSDKELLCGVTSKYLKAITRKIWIVSVLWILNNINSSKFLNPELFEIKGDNVFKFHNGPRNSRLSPTGLFERHEFMFVGEYSEETISLSTIMELARLSGASLKTSPSEFTPGKSTSKLVVFDETKMLFPAAKAARIRENLSAVCVNKAWLLDSLACFKLLDTKQYETYS